MGRLTRFAAIGLFGVVVNGWGYGGGGGADSTCPKPQFADFQPPQGSEVSPGAPFSFKAWSVLPETLRVTVQGQEVPIQVAPKGGKLFRITGKLPAELKGSYVRINISGYGPGRCHGVGGWLLKIGG